MTIDFLYKLLKSMPCQARGSEAPYELLEGRGVSLKVGDSEDGGGTTMLLSQFWTNPHFQIVYRVGIYQKLSPPFTSSLFPLLFAL
jgi:hypothetical protein